ncbi:MAG: hypothetical protein ABEJ65_02770 [bacterium]
MKTVTFRVDDKLKKEMDRLSINWSEYLRGAVRTALDKEKVREIHQKLRNREETKEGTAQELIREIRNRG